VFAIDMFSSLFQEDPMGRRYRETVLVKGGSRDEMELLHELLGRAPNADAFAKELSLAKLR